MTPNDPGPIYTETLLASHPDSWPIEPWNTWSNIIFVAIIIHTVLRTRLDYRRYPLVVFSLPVLTIGFLGGTIYHATRSHALWLFLDFIPILVLTSAAAVSYWRALVGSTPKAVLCFLLVATSGRVLAGIIQTERAVTISLGYLAAALSIVTPLFFLVRKQSRDERMLLAGIIVTFASAVGFRMIDRPTPGVPLEPILPMGTHFLWHLCGGLAVWLLMILTIRLCDSKQAHRE
jgi:hypothetical protein